MCWNDFGRSLLFGAVAAAAFVPFAIVAAPHLGWGGTLAAYAVASASAYLAGLGATRRQGLGAGLLVGLLGTGALIGIGGLLLHVFDKPTHVAPYINRIGVAVGGRF